MTQNINFPNPKPPVRFGVKVSETHPSFELGEYTFKTLLIGLNEDRWLTKQQAAFPKAAKMEDGTDAELSEEQQEETLNHMAGLVAGLLRKRLITPPDASENINPDVITTNWVLDNMTSADFGPLMYFLRQGHPQDAYDDDREAELDNLGDTDPNAEA